MMLFHPAEFLEQIWKNILKVINSGIGEEDTASIFNSYLREMAVELDDEDFVDQ